MKIRLNTLMIGPEGGFAPGSEIDVDNARARDLIAGNYASAVKSPRRGEIADRTAAEHAAFVPPSAEQQAALNLQKIKAAEAAAAHQDGRR